MTKISLSREAAFGLLKLGALGASVSCRVFSKTG
jgi:hypothetical protein